MSDDSSIAGHRFIEYTAQIGVERRLKSTVWVLSYGLMATPWLQRLCKRRKINEPSVGEVEQTSRRAIC